MTSDWPTVEAIVRQIVSGPEPFTAEAIAHIDDFLKYLRETTSAPTVGPGYPPNTLEIWWDRDPAMEPAKTVQFVVHPRMIEVLRFCGRKVTGIQEIRHSAGEPFPHEIGAQLESCGPMRGAEP